MTVSELNALYRHEIKKRQREKELAILSGYTAAKAVAMWFTEGLPAWEEFYIPPAATTKPEPNPTYTSEEYIARYESWQ